MKKPIHFDEEAIGAAVDKQIAALASHLEDDNQIGVQARFLTRTLRAAQMALIAEVNRGTGSELMMCGIMSLATNISMSFMASIYNGDQKSMEQGKKYLLKMFHHFLVSCDLDECKMGPEVQKIEPTIGGNA